MSAEHVGRGHRGLNRAQRIAEHNARMTPKVVMGLLTELGSPTDTSVVSLGHLESSPTADNVREAMRIVLEYGTAQYVPGSLDVQYNGPGGQASLEYAERTAGGSNTRLAKLTLYKQKLVGDPAIDRTRESFTFEANPDKEDIGVGAVPTNLGVVGAAAQLATFVAQARGEK